MRHFLLSFFIPLLLVSCNKKELEEIEPAPPVIWEVHDYFLHNQRYISNLYSSDDKLQVMGMHLFSTISLEGGKEDVKHYVHPFQNVSHHKHPMNSKVFGGTDGDYLRFKTVSDPVLSGSGLLIEVATLDPLFREFSLIMSYSNESFAISENNVALVPYNFYNEETGRHSLRYLLVKLAVEKDVHNNDKLVLEETRILTPAEQGGVVRHMRSHQDNFYVATDWGFYKFSKEGEISFQMPHQIAYTSFDHKGEIYAFARHGTRQTHGLFRYGSGQSWSMDAQIGNSAEMLAYHAISDELLLASYNSQIFEVELGVDKLIVRELDNTGLEGHYITSIAMVKDKVYIGTHSGLFSKAAEHLLTYKEEEK
ncbi:hypothetical protein [Pontibacter flavimaris]|uniref:Lipoprotein n=1 Tax=Pontibacter flavimaris TaxID=1797110 RepID=A0A1Q5PB70_9BACT|nr:hypothetical protein [Pontibacter flavimaris]OKL39476.1 hypothetical protein A3841_02645 [Pontibacter flavimaris]